MVPYTAPHVLILKHSKKHRIVFLYKRLSETFKSLYGYQMLLDPKPIFCFCWFSFKEALPCKGKFAELPSC